MKTSTMISRIAVLGIISSLAINAAFCAPQQQAKQQASSFSSTTVATNPQSTTISPKSTTSSSSSSTASSSSNNNNNGDNQHSAILARSSVGAPISSVNMRDDLAETAAQTESSSNSNQDDLNGETFDGKNPFSDDSLWQIPFHYVRDLNTAADGNRNGQSVVTKPITTETTSSDSSSSLLDDAAEIDEPSQFGSNLAPARSSRLLSSSSSSAASSPTIISPAASSDLKTAAGYHYPATHGGHHGNSGSHYGGHGSHDADHYGGKYFQYVNVPKPYAWEFGYRRGNPYHTIERYEHGKGPHFQTKVKWSDKHGGYGVHVWDYNHDDHHPHHYEKPYHAGKHHEGASEHHAGAHYGHH